MNIEGSGALVAGGASGLGEATARYLAEHGAKVTLLDMDDAKGPAVAEAVIEDRQ